MDTILYLLPTYALAVTREGEGIFAAGIGAQAVSGVGAVNWRDPLDAYDVILEKAADQPWRAIHGCCHVECGRHWDRHFGFSESRFNEKGRAFAVGNTAEFAWRGE